MIGPWSFGCQDGKSQSGCACAEMRGSALLLIGRFIKRALTRKEYDARRAVLAVPSRFVRVSPHKRSSAGEAGNLGEECESSTREPLSACSRWAEAMHATSRNAMAPQGSTWSSVHGATLAAWLLLLSTKTLIARARASAAWQLARRL